jgi:hypothetical protein
MRRKNSAAEQLSVMLRNQVKNSYSTHYITDSVQANLTATSSKAFIPFIQERDGIGRLLPSNSVTSLPKVRKESDKTDLPLKRQNSAFNSTISKTTRRRHLEIYPSPPIGLYDPKPAYMLTAYPKPTTKHTSSIRLSKAQRAKKSTDYIDYDRAYEAMKKRVSGFSMQRQLAREKAEHDYEKERAELYRPAFEMPKHLRKFKGLFHVSDFQPEDTKVMKRNSDDIRAKVSTIQSTIAGLKDFGKEITRHMFMSERRLSK